MLKILQIAWKDIRLNFRDSSALLIAIAAPFGMTLIMGWAFGGGSQFAAVPVGLVNLDQGSLGHIYEDVLFSDELKEMIVPTMFSDSDEAEIVLEQDELAAVIVLPQDLSESITDPSRLSESSPAKAAIQIIGNPLRPISTQIIEAIVETINLRVNSGIISSRLVIETLIQEGGLSPEQILQQAAPQLISPDWSESSASFQITLRKIQQEETAAGFDWLSYMAPSMAILFISFSMSTCARGFLVEREEGTLQRLLIAPRRPIQILTGKMLGTFLTGLIQVFILILASRFFLGIRWGNPILLVIFTICVISALSGWGILIATLSQNSGQAAGIGMAVNLTFAALAGNFVPRAAYPQWLQQASFITPNAWGIEGYTKLIAGNAQSDVITGALVLFAMAAILLSISSLFFTRQYHS